MWTGYIIDQIALSVQSDLNLHYPQKLFYVFNNKERVNSLPNNNFLDWSNLNKLADDNNYDRKIEIWFGTDGKHCGKRRTCWLPTCSPFPKMFSKGLFLRVIKSRDCVVKS